MHAGTLAVIFGVLGVAAYLAIYGEMKRHTRAAIEAKNNNQPTPERSLKVKICLSCFFIFMLSSAICSLYRASQL